MRAILIYGFFIITFFQGCDYYNHEELLLINNSKQNIVYVYSFNPRLTVENSNYNKDTLKIGDSIRSMSRNSWRYNIKNLSKDNTLRIYFVNTTYFQKHNWNDIIEQKKYILKKYSLKELDSLKWVVEYNGK